MPCNGVAVMTAQASNLIQYLSDAGTEVEHVMVLVAQEMLNASTNPLLADCQIRLASNAGLPEVLVEHPAGAFSATTVPYGSGQWKLQVEYLSFVLTQAKARPIQAAITELVNGAFAAISGKLLQGKVAEALSALGDIETMETGADGSLMVELEV